MWSKILGHASLIEGFSRARSRGRLAHAFLFTGPQGVGKRLFAGELAKALLCEKSTSEHLEACDRCASCLLVDAGTHPDCFTAGKREDKNEIIIEDMLELCRNFSLKPARGKGKVGILDQADDLNPESANAFLKTLEEPPPQSTLILIGSSRDRQLPTVASRCQIIRFEALPVGSVFELLKQQGVTDEALARRLATLAGGSPGQALALADPALWMFRNTLLQGLVKTPLPAVELAKAWMEFVAEAGKETAPQRRRAGLVLRLLIHFFGEVLAHSLGGPARAEEAEDVRLVENLGNRLSPDQVSALLERCLEAEKQLDGYVQIVLVLEGLLESMAQIVER